MFEGLAINDLAFKVEAIVNVEVDRSEFIHGHSSLQQTDHALPWSRAKVTVFRAVVCPLVNLATIEIPHFAQPGGLGFVPVSEDGFGLAVALQRLLHEGKCRWFLSLCGHVALADIAPR